MLTRAHLQSYLDDLTVGETPALFLFFPNFEERSVTAAEFIARHKRVGRMSKAMVYWLQGAHPTEILDEIKCENTQRVLNACRQTWQDVSDTELSYPNPDQRLFQAAVRRRLSMLGPSADIVVDVSGTPRDMLFQLFEFLFPDAATWPYKVGSTTIRAIYFIYSWAQSYPASPGPELLGDLRGHYSHKSLFEVLRERQNVHLVVCGAGTGHDALQAITIADRTVPNARLRSDVFLLLNRKNPLRSFNQMMRHQSLVRHLRRSGRAFRMVFSVEHFSAAVMRSAIDAAAEHVNGNGAFVVGPFGPKPLGLCAYFAAREYRRLSVNSGAENNEVDILDLNSAQYLTLYSIGVGETEMFRIVEPRPV